MVTNKERTAKLEQKSKDMEQANVKHILLILSINVLITISIFSLLQIETEIECILGFLLCLVIYPVERRMIAYLLRPQPKVKTIDEIIDDEWEKYHAEKESLKEKEC